MEPPDEHGDTARRVQRELVISILALVSVAIGLYQLTRRDESPSFSWLDAVDLGIVAIFVADFVVQARRCGWRLYLRRHWWELPSMIPASGILVQGVPGFSIVRGVRLVRLVRVLRLLRIVGLAVRFRRVARYVRNVARRANVLPILGVGAAIVSLGALLGYALERDTGSRLSDLGDAFWWALNMVTNVAYVDFQPATVQARVLAGVLEVAGIGFIGVFTASLAGAIVREPRPDEEDEGRV